MLLFINFIFYFFSGDHDSSLRGESPPKWSHLNVLSAAAAVASAAHPLKQHCANENTNGSPLSESPLHHSYHHHHQQLSHQQLQQQHHSHGHLGLQSSVHSQSPAASHHSHTTISSQFSALLGASSGYLLSSESKTMPIF